MPITRADSLAGHGRQIVRRDQLTGLRAAAAKVRAVVADLKGAWRAAMGQTKRMEERARAEFRCVLEEHAQWTAQMSDHLTKVLPDWRDGRLGLRFKESKRAMRALDDLLLPPDRRVGKLDWQEIKANFMVLRRCRDQVQYKLRELDERSEAQPVVRRETQPEPQPAVWAQAHSSWVNASNLRDLRHGSGEPTAVAQGPVAVVEDQALAPELHVAVTRAVSAADVQKALRDKARRHFGVDVQFQFNPLAAQRQHVMVTSLPEQPVAMQVQLSPDGHEHHRRAAVSVQTDAAELGAAPANWPRPEGDAPAPGKPDA